MPTIPYKLKDGTRVKGSTSLIDTHLGWSKKPLMWWAYEQGKLIQQGKINSLYDKAEEAADAGTWGHWGIEHWLKHGPFLKSDVPPEFLDSTIKCVDNFREWKKAWKFEVHASEVHLVSEKWGFGSTPDCIGLIDDKYVLFDWKTGKDVYESAWIQLASYKVNWEENNPDKPIEEVHLLRIDKETAAFDHYWREAKVLQPAWETFKHLLELERLHKEVKKI